MGTCAGALPTERWRSPAPEPHQAAAPRLVLLARRGVHIWAVAAVKPPGLGSWLSSYLSHGLGVSSPLQASVSSPVKRGKL